MDPSSFTPLSNPSGSRERGRVLERLRTDSFDVLVVGGGITGCGIALDAALRGLRVALIEKGDFASGTSSASSKLIHGGLRYLEYGEFGLVREALHERHTLLRIAPHLVRPFRVLIPQYRTVGRPRWMVKIGLTLYDWLAGRERVGRHRSLTNDQLVDAASGLRTDGLRGGFEFYDAQMDDARLCLEVALTAIGSGAAAANYVELVSLRHDREGHACGCDAVDRVSGEPLGITARCVVNATGPWLDEVCRKDNRDTPVRLAPTKGVHIVLPAMGLRAGLLVLHPDDGRVMFVLPWMGRTLVGTTDTFFERPPDDVTATPDDVDYLLAATNYYFGQSLTSEQVVASMVGLRPLLQHHASGPSAVSRECSIFRSSSGLFSIAGGKYTTYRSMAESLVNRVVVELGGSVANSPSCTAGQRLIGAPVGDWHTFRSQERILLSSLCRLDRPQIDHLIDRYGVRARQVVEEFGGIPELCQPVISGEPETWAEIQFQATHEWAVTAQDHLLRRSRLGLFHRELLAGGAGGLKWPMVAELARLGSK